MDLRGHGRGIRPRAYFRLEDCADDAVAVADALGIQRIVPVGYSMGGAVAQLVAHRHPARCAGLVLCSTSAGFRSPGGSDRLMWDGFVPAVAAALTFTPAALRQQLLARFVTSQTDGRVPAWVAEEMRRNDPAAVAQAGLALSRFDSTDWIGQLGRTGTAGVAAAVVVTTKDGTVPPARQRALAAALSGAHVFDVPADHRAAITAANVWVPQLRNALAAVLR
jgi:3-oxoadipate enol-lactonase